MRWRFVNINAALIPLMDFAATWTGSRSGRIYKIRFSILWVKPPRIVNRQKFNLGRVTNLSNTIVCIWFPLVEYEHFVSGFGKIVTKIARLYQVKLSLQNKLTLWSRGNDLWTALSLFADLQWEEKKKLCRLWTE